MKQPLPKRFNIHEVEEKWQKKWEEMGIHHFDWDDKTRPTFSIDTPPPYPSGEFHMGNVLNWTYFDIVARYRRMKGCNVFFPQGWDCHGLGIEVEVERVHNVRKRDVPPGKFRRWCEQTVEKYITMMKNSIIHLGCSVDWSTEYRTMDQDYWRLTQLSFILSYKKDFIYRGTHPVNWCPRCETAIADAEVEYQQREGKLYFIEFPLENDREYLLIATTRPELLPACVAVAINPDDDRYKKFSGRKLRAPIADRVVEIIEDDMVEPEFGTGAVMICTYGDKADVKTVLKNKLPVIMTLTEDGKISEEGGKYAGLSIIEARKAIVEDLGVAELLEKTGKVQQEIGTCERCGTPIEILERKQWFMKTRVLTDEVVKAANEVKWYPNYMKNRMIDWALSLDWDWVISRQRVFGTPIPIWYCKNCNRTILAEESWVPIDPKLEKPKIKECPECGSTDFIPEKDVFDTWMDSSITCAVHAGWPKLEDWRRLFPADVHPSGIDIIRTWAYYLMVRHLALFGEKPYKSCLINGMVLGADGRKMSKSLKNYVATPKVLRKYGADAARQWAAVGGATGSDIPFRWPDVKYGWRFLIKLWNASRFVTNQLGGFKLNEDFDPQALDKWIISRVERLTQRVTEALDKRHFNIAMEDIRNFTWHVFCDLYLEAIKDRLYKPELYGESESAAAKHTLYLVLYRILQIVAPIIPHITEEIYQIIYAEDVGYKSIHLSPWPIVNEERINKEVEKSGELIMAIIAGVRREKAEMKKPLNTEIRKLIVYAGGKERAEKIKGGREDIAGTCKVANIEIVAGEGTGQVIEPYDGLHFVTEY